MDFKDLTEESIASSLRNMFLDELNNVSSEPDVIVIHNEKQFYATIKNNNINAHTGIGGLQLFFKT